MATAATAYYTEHTGGALGPIEIVDLAGARVPTELASNHLRRRALENVTGIRPAEPGRDAGMLAQRNKHHDTDTLIHKHHVKDPQTWVVDFASDGPAPQDRNVSSYFPLGHGDHVSFVFQDLLRANGIHVYSQRTESAEIYASRDESGKALPPPDPLPKPYYSFMTSADDAPKVLELARKIPAIQEALKDGVRITRNADPRSAKGAEPPPQTFRG